MIEIHHRNEYFVLPGFFLAARYRNCSSETSGEMETCSFVRWGGHQIGGYAPEGCVSQNPPSPPAVAPEGCAPGVVVHPLWRCNVGRRMLCNQTQFLQLRTLCDPRLSSRYSVCKATRLPSLSLPNKHSMLLHSQVGWAKLVRVGICSISTFAGDEFDALESRLFDPLHAGWPRAVAATGMSARMHTQGA